ncbi:hypothetical protein PBN151_4404 [Paenibacillus sp. NAIST15-1]|nr:hypothetical protein PBN151_4404 [Paenibacillus sp. NAIST15-1]
MQEVKVGDSYKISNDERHESEFSCESGKTAFTAHDGRGSNNNAYGGWGLCQIH